MGHIDDLGYLPDLMSTLKKSSTPVLKQYVSSETKIELGLMPRRLDESMAFVFDSLDRLQTRSLLQAIRGGSKDPQSDIEKAVDEEVRKLREAIEVYENKDRLEVGKHRYT